MSEITVIQLQDLGKGFALNPITKQIQLLVHSDYFAFDNENKLILNPEFNNNNSVRERDKFQIEITNNDFSVSNKWDYYAYVLNFHNGMGIFHLRIHTRNEFTGQARLGQFPANCFPKDLFEIKDQKGLVDIWASDRYITIASDNTLSADTRLDFHGVISLQTT